MKSKEQSPLLDLELGIPTTTKDLAALRSLRRAPMSAEEYLKFLAEFHFPPATLRTRKHPRGEPFTLG